jgi:SAM-dependent methyltransferase
MNDETKMLQRTLWKIYRRRPKPIPWVDNGNLPWDDPDFSKRMLLEHLDDSHGAASRQPSERRLQIDWLWSKCGLQPGSNLLDVTCGPGLYAVEFANRGCFVTGIDFSPASIDYARQLAASREVSDRCNFIQQDVREADLSAAAPEGGYDAAIFLYGQLAVFPMATADKLLANIVGALRPGGLLCLELLDQDKVNKEDSSWWFTDDKGLWGSEPFLHLGERFWLEAEALSIERYLIIDLDSGNLTEIALCDQTYSVPVMTTKLLNAGFHTVDPYPAWAGLPLYDAGEWVLYLART